jgi:hypothetical protein
VPDGFDLKLNPKALVADHLIVTGLLSSRPEDPGGLVTADDLTGVLCGIAQVNIRGPP